jgi:hypothetical protein
VGYLDEASTAAHALTVHGHPLPNLGKVETLRYRLCTNRLYGKYPLSLVG